MNANGKEILRGEIWFADFGDGVGSEQKGERPCLIISNDTFNYFSKMVTVFAITGNFDKKKTPVHVELLAEQYNLSKNSIVLVETIRTISKDRLLHKLSELDEVKMDEVETAAKVQLGLIPLPKPQPRSQQTQRKPFMPIPVPSYQPTVAFA